MSTKLTGCVLLAKSVLLLLDCSPKKTAALCGYNSKKSWLLAVEKARKEAMTKKATKKSSKKPIALLCPASGLFTSGMFAILKFIDVSVNFFRLDQSVICNLEAKHFSVAFLKFMNHLDVCRCS